MIQFEVDALFTNFAGLVIASFFVNPPPVCPLFAFHISKLIAVAGTGQKYGAQQNNAQGRGDKSTFGKERFHDGANPQELMFSLFFRLLKRKLDLFF